MKKKIVQSKSGSKQSDGIQGFPWRRRMQEGIFLFWVTVSLFFAIALLSYHNTDPAWSNTGYHHQVLNWGGRVGAYLADIFFSWFGWVAYAVPPLCMMSAWYKLRESVTQSSHSHLIWSTLGWCLFFSSASALSQLLFPKAVFSWSHVGGILGDLTARLLSLFFSRAGSILITSAILLFSLTLITGFSWLQLFRNIRDGIRDFILNKKNAMKEAYVKWYAERQLTKAKQAAEKQLNAKRILKKPDLDPLEKSKDIEVKKEIEKTEQNNSSKIVAISEKINHSDRIVSPIASEEERQEPVLFLDLNRSSMAPARLEKETSSMPNTRELPRVLEKKLDQAILAPLKSEIQSEQVAVSSAQHSRSAEPSGAIEMVPLQSGELPSLELLDMQMAQDLPAFSRISLERLGCLVEERLADFGVSVKVTAVLPGPVITRFELELAAGVKVSKIAGLAKDIARSLSVVSVRIVDVIAGKSVIGLEIPNEHREKVSLRSVLESQRYQQFKSPLSLALGKDISGQPIVVDLGKMPHLLVAGTTGSGKSVSLNVMLLSMLFKAKPEELRLILIDPKMLELSVYEGIPHLLTPVIIDMKEAANALRWCVAEMDRRYRLMASLGVRHLAGYNQKILEAKQAGTPLSMPMALRKDPTVEETLDTLPFIVVIIDELADLMMVVGKKIEDLIARLAQKARAAGIHLIVATQRPSVDVITGLIKANIPTRMAFQVSSRIDSRTILDQQGAEQLLGHGDMLYLPAGAGIPIRVHGAYVTDEEVHRVVASWRMSARPDYQEEITQAQTEHNLEVEGNAEEVDSLYDEALKIVTETRRASISLVQRRLRIGYNRAARLLEAMELAGVVSSMDHSGLREVLAPSPVEIE